MGQRPYTRLSWNHRDDHGPRLIATGAAEANGSADRAVPYEAIDSRRQLMAAVAGLGVAQRDARKVVPLFRAGASDSGRAGRPIRVLLAEGQALVRAGYRALLESSELIEVVGEAATYDEAIACANETSPDVAVLDLGLLGLQDLEATARIISHPAFAKVAVMLMAPRRCDDHVLDAVMAGAVGVLAKDAEPTELIRAVQLVARGQALLPVPVVRHLFSELRAASGQQADPSGQFAELTEREREVLALVARGLSNDEIAEHLVISRATAKTHVSRAMLKLGATHRAQLVVLAYESGLVQPRSQNAEWLTSPVLAAEPEPVCT
jgi:DNA-binding NarL/FixJ family response regulator